MRQPLGRTDSQAGAAGRSGGWGVRRGGWGEWVGQPWHTLRREAENTDFFSTFLLHSKEYNNT